jgi:hypothetical protein
MQVPQIYINQRKRKHSFVRFWQDAQVHAEPCSQKEAMIGRFLFKRVHPGEKGKRIAPARVQTEAKEPLRSPRPRAVKARKRIVVFCSKKCGARLDDAGKNR